MIVATEEGVVYTLRFGEVVFASGEELSAGVEESAEKEKTKKDAKKPEGADREPLPDGHGRLRPHPDPRAQARARSAARPSPTTRSSSPPTTPSGSPRRRPRRRRPTAARPIRTRRSPTARSASRSSPTGSPTGTTSPPAESFRSIALDREPAWCGRSGASRPPRCPRCLISRAATPVPQGAEADALACSCIFTRLHYVLLWRSSLCG